MENVAISHLKNVKIPVCEKQSVCFCVSWGKKMADAPTQTLFMYDVTALEHVFEWGFIETANEYRMWWTMLNNFKLS